MMDKLRCNYGIKPTRAHPDDAGLDLRSAAACELMEGEMAMVPTGFRCNIPRGYVGLLVARSSLCKRGLVMPNGVGVIDAGYTGEIQVPLVAFCNTEIRYFERIAQLVIVPCEYPELKWCKPEDLGETERGADGFGSSGTGGA